MKKIKLATVFSGIGAIEHALERMSIDYEIVMACDNGEVDIFSKKIKATTINELKKELNSLSKEKISSELKKEYISLKNEINDIKLEKEIKKYKKKLSEFYGKIKVLNIKEEIKDFSFEEKKKYIDNLYEKALKRNKVRQSYFANYYIKEEDFHWNVSFLDGRQYKNKVDLFVGGSPCQSFSISGHRKGFEDTRGTLFYDYARLIKEMQPKIFIYENVKGLLSHDKGKTWKIIKEVFDSLGYKLHYEILNAKNYGIPQNRNRIFVVGFRKDLILKDKFEFPKPIPLEKTMQDFLIENTDYTKENEIKIKNELEKYFLSQKLIKTVLSTGTKNFSLKPETDLKIARPLLKTMHKMHRAGTDNYVTTFGRLRKLTPRECLRLMGFSDSFKIVVSNTAMYQQAGNSIVVDILIKIMEQIFKIYNFK